MGEGCVFCTGKRRMLGDVGLNVDNVESYTSARIEGKFLMLTLEVEGMFGEKHDDLKCVDIKYCPICGREL